MTRDAAGRTAVALGLLLAWASLGRVTRTEGMPYAPFGLDALPMNGAVEAGASVVFAVAWAAFLLRRSDDASRVILAVLLAFGTKVMEWQAPPGMGINGATMLPGAALLASWIARRTTRDAVERERRGIEAACGIVAACYAVAVASKLSGSGIGWASAGNIGMQIATQAYLAPEPFRSLRLAAGASPALCAGVGTATLFIEGGTLLFVLPAARVPVAMLLVGMHIGISLLMGLHHYDWMCTALGWALISSARRRGVTT